MCPSDSSPPPLNAPSNSTPFPWPALAHDAHCHPTDTPSNIPQISNMQTSTLVLMSTRAQDQSLVASTAVEHPDKVIPAFGWHPWFSYQIYDDIFSPVEDDKNARLAAVLSPAPDEAFTSALPPLHALSTVLSDLRARLAEHPHAMVGEVGLDRAFRLPRPWGEGEEPRGADNGGEEAPTPGGREGRLLSPHRVQLGHQVLVMRAQLAVAAEMGRAVSVHGVQAHGALFDAISAMWKGHEKRLVSRRERRAEAENAEAGWESSDEEDDGAAPSVGTKGGSGGKGEDGDRDGEGGEKLPYPPRICLHSFSGPAQVMRQWCDPRVPSRIFFSFSTAVNFGGANGDEKTREVIAACPDDRILVESDLHMAGEKMDAALEDIYRRVCEIKGWGLEEGLKRIGANFREFVYGDRDGGQ